MCEVGILVNENSLIQMDLGTKIDLKLSFVVSIKTVMVMNLLWNQSVRVVYFKLCISTNRLEDLNTSSSWVNCNLCISSRYFSTSVANETYMEKI